MAAPGVTPQSFARSLLGALKVPTTPQNVQAITGWIHAESGTNYAGVNGSIKYNPLNTTQPMPGSYGTGAQGNIQSYQNWQQGLNGTVKTLLNGRYGNILGALRAGNNPQAVAAAIGSSPWGTSGSLVSQAIKAAAGMTGGGAPVGGGLPTPTAQPGVKQGPIKLSTTTSYLQHGPSQPTKASILGSYLANEPKVNPWGDTSLSPLVSSGVLPSTVQYTSPVQKVTLNAQNTVALKAQNTLQTLAGTTTLNVHPDTGAGGQKVAAMTAMAKKLIGKPYVWGGGHGGWGIQSGYDCSGFVSAVLHAAGYLSAPQTTQTLPSQAGIQSGPGRFVTIYDRTNASPSNDHVIIDINGSWFESGGSASAGGGGGVKHIPKPPGWYLGSFNRTLHPQGL